MTVGAVLMSGSFARGMWVQVEKVVEEEYCLIPMGGVLPQRDQRIIGVGSTAGLVHPSTGYMVARALATVPQLADRIVDELALPLPETVPTGVARQPQAGRFVAASQSTAGPAASRTLALAAVPCSPAEMRGFFYHPQT
jgi:hypothetical protein